MARTEINMADGDAASTCGSRESAENFLVAEGYDADAVYNMSVSELKEKVQEFIQNSQDYSNALHAALEKSGREDTRHYMVSNGENADKVSGMSDPELYENAAVLQENGGLTSDEMRAELKKYLAKTGFSEQTISKMTDKKLQETAVAQQDEEGVDPVIVVPSSTFLDSLNYTSGQSSAVADYLHGQGGGPPPEWFRAQMAWIRSLEAGGWLRGYGGDIDPADPNADAGIGAAGAPCGSDGRFLGDPSGPDHPGIGTSHTDPQAGGDIDYEEAPVQTNGRYNEYNVSGSHDDGTAGIRLSNGNGRLSEENEALTRARLGGS